MYRWLYLCTDNVVPLILLSIFSLVLSVLRHDIFDEILGHGILTQVSKLNDVTNNYTCK